jgi:hypothetical protein
MQGGNIRQTWSLDGDQEVIRQLRSIGTAGEKAAADLRAATGNASAGLDALASAVGPVQAAFGRLSGFAGEAAGPLSKIVDAFGSLTTGLTGLGVTISGVAAGLFALAKMGSSATNEVRHGAARTGESTDEFQRMLFVFQRSGADASAFDKAMAVVLDASSKAEEAAANSDQSAKSIAAANESVAKSSTEITDLFRKKNLDIAEEQRRSGEQIADLTRKRGTDEEEIQFQSNRRIADINRKATQELNDIIRRRNEENRANLDKFNKDIEDAADKAVRGTNNKFGQLNIALLDAAGKARSPSEVFKDTAAQIAKIQSPTEQAAKAVELFGRRIGLDLVETLSKGRDGIDKLADSGKRLGLFFDEAEIKVGKEFGGAVGRLGATITATAEKIGLLFAPAFTAVFDTLGQTFGSLQKPILDALRPIADDLKNLFTGNLDQVNSQFLLALRDVAVVVGAAFNVLGAVVGGVLRTLGAGFQAIADVVNSVFGTKFTAVDIPAFIIAVKAGATALGILRVAFIALSTANPFLAILTAITLAVGALAPLIMDNWPAIVETVGSLGQVLNTAADAIKSAVGTAVDFVSQKVQATKGFFVDLGTAIGTAFDTALKAVQDAFARSLAWLNDNFIQPVVDFFQTVIDKARELGAAIVAVLGPIAGAIGANAGNIGDQNLPAGARGGRVIGPGSGTSDSILARLSHGEFVVNAAATRAFLPLLDAINRGILPQLKGFAMGGLASRAAMPIRQVGPIGGSAQRTIAPFLRNDSRPVTLIFGETKIDGLNAPESVVRELISVARMARVRSLGRKPAYYGA